MAPASDRDTVASCTPPAVAPDPEAAASAIVALLAQRQEGASICPSEAARHLAGPAGWRGCMPVVREAARHLARAGGVEVTQRGVPLAPDAPWRGAVRIRRSGR